MADRTALREAILFSVITMGLSYLVFWGPIALFGIQTVSFVSSVRGPLWAIIVFIIGGFVPSVVASIMTDIAGGPKSLGALLKRSIQFGLGAKWYAGIFVVVLLGAAGQITLNLLLGYRFNFAPYGSQLSSLIPLIVLGPLSEEYGWRGYLLVRLQRRWNALTSSLAVGVVWGMWHLPLFYIVGTSQHELRLPFFGFFVGVLGVSVLMTWVSNNTRNSIWAAILFHWIHTYTIQVDASGVTRTPVYNWLEFAPYVVIAVVVVIVWGPKNLMRNRDRPSVPTAG